MKKKKHQPANLVTSIIVFFTYFFFFFKFSIHRLASKKMYFVCCIKLHISYRPVPPTAPFLSPWRTIHVDIDNTISCKHIHNVILLLYIIYVCVYLYRTFVLVYTYIDSKIFAVYVCVCECLFVVVLFIRSSLQKINRLPFIQHINYASTMETFCVWHEAYFMHLVFPHKFLSMLIFIYTYYVYIDAENVRQNFHLLLTFSS